jgi:hypothetical protein
LRIPVLPATELLVVKLRSLSEHYCDFGALLPAVRAVREQVDWPRVREEVGGNPYARAFLYLADELGISDHRTPAERVSPGATAAPRD